nr:hypothetical protein [Tanacetum cinerariifolium]
MKTEALKEQAKAKKPVKALTVYPSNTHVKLVPKTCKKRITPTDLTEAERDFEQTKKCYLTEVLPFFKTLKEHFKGIQKAQTTEIKEMKMIFDELEAKADQNVVNRKYSVTPKVLVPGMYAIYVEPIPSRLRNNREVHLDYLKHLKESVETLCEIVEEVKVERPLDRSVVSACLYTKHFQELLEYVIGTCPKDFNKRDKKQATTLLNRKKQVTFADQCETSNTNTQKHVEQQITQKTNVPVLLFTGVDSCTDASGSKPKSNTKKIGSRQLKVSIRRQLNTTSGPISLICKNRIVLILLLALSHLNYVNAPSSAKNVVRKVKQVWKPKHVKQVWKATGIVLTTVGYQWKPTGRIFTLGEQCPLTMFTHPKVVPTKQPENVSTSKSVIIKNSSHTSQKPLTRYQRRNKQNKAVPAGIPTPTDVAMQSAVAYAN